MTSLPPTLETRGLRAGYPGRVIIDSLDVTIAPGSFTVILGANASGKSTLLRSLARLLKPLDGSVLLSGDDVQSLGSRQLARRLGLLPQQTTTPTGITIVDLVTRGRHPHQGMFSRWSAADEAAVRSALEATQLTELSQRPVEELSGGQRQRVLLAMVLAQETPLMLLDEPTTFLDIAHQVDVLELCARLNTEGRTLVVVLHDINQAARYASDLIVMRDGEIIAQGTPADVVTPELIERAYGLRCRVIEDPETHTPLIIPLKHAGAERVAAQESTPPEKEDTP